MAKRPASLTSPLALATGVVLLTATASAQQPSIYVDLGPSSAGYGIPSNTFGAAALTGGEWNELDCDLATGGMIYTTPPLMDVAGQATGVTIEWSSTAGGLLPFSTNEPNTLGDDEALMDDIGYVVGAHEFKVEGLPPGNYDVYTYAMAPDSAAFTSLVDVVGAANGQQTVGGAFPGTYILGVTHAFHTVTVAMGGDIVIQVDTGASNNSVNGIQIIPEGGAGSIGTRYCSPAVTNSGGQSAEMFASGSIVTASNSLTISCLQMPAQVFGFFIVSQTQANVPMAGGSAGTLCVGGSVGRYVGPGQIMNSGPMGEMTLPIDLTMIPQPTGFVSVNPGETWNFQAWFRDTQMGMVTSNFSDALELMFI